jgi:mitogen-activated protein kinase kinase kinase
MTLLISHFDILGARSSYEAKKEQERIDAARLQTKQQLAARLAALKETRRKEDDEDEESIGSLQMAWEQRLEAIKALEESRAAVESGGRAVGRVLDHNLAEDRSLAFLASSSLSNISLRWQQGKFIGGGAFGNVYLAVNLDSGEELAVKEIRFQDLQSAPHLVKTIRDEMKVMEMLRHDNIVQYYGIEVHRDKVYIFEEYCPGGSLANLLEHGRIEDEIIIQIYALQLLSGLIYLHSQNVVHRDIKPDSSFCSISPLCIFAHRSFSHRHSPRRQRHHQICRLRRRQSPRQEPKIARLPFPRRWETRFRSSRTRPRHARRSRCC